MVSDNVRREPVFNLHRKQKNYERIVVVVVVVNNNHICTYKVLKT